jgi:hypothetical protein
MVRACHPGDPTERLHGRADALVVGGHHDRVHERRGGSPAVHVLDHRPAADVGERLPGETGRPVARGDDGDVSGAGKRVGVRGVPVRVHGES